MYKKTVTQQFIFRFTCKAYAILYRSKQVKQYRTTMEVLIILLLMAAFLDLVVFDGLKSRSHRSCYHGLSALDSTLYDGIWNIYSGFQGMQCSLKISDYQFYNV